MYIKVHVVADAKNEKVVRESETTYHIEVKEPRERNLANNRIRELLCREFGLDKGKVRLISGHRSLSKVFSVETEVNSS